MANSDLDVSVTDLTVAIRRRASFEGHPCTEIFYTYTEDGVQRDACTRLPYALDDSPHARANEAQQFTRRRQMRRNWSCA